ncbi:hypothetical protein [Embleya scabrispora]|uniref:hypothetical protein n=1 Tax=Embleya scabrispora TaxID=159449 RepID=UPI00039CC3A6|nr:hypothetical protein [Embleya scabrispora]MYS87492.1 hypothetical protein [Streptomyces sp. SID5474]
MLDLAGWDWSRHWPYLAGALVVLASAVLVERARRRAVAERARVAALPEEARKALESDRASTRDRRGRRVEDLLTAAVSAAAAGLSAAQLGKFGRDVMGLHGPWAYLPFVALDFAAVVCALRARRRAARGAAAGLSGALVWVLALLSASMSASEGANLGEAFALGIWAPIAAVLWELGLAEERHARTERADRRVGWIRWLHPIERILVLAELAGDEHMGAAEATERVRQRRAARALYRLRQATEARAARVDGAGRSPARPKRAIDRRYRRAEAFAQRTAARVRLADAEVEAAVLPQLRVLVDVGRLANMTWPTPDVTEPARRRDGRPRLGATTTRGGTPRPTPARRVAGVAVSAPLDPSSTVPAPTVPEPGHAAQGHEHLHRHPAPASPNNGVRTPTSRAGAEEVDRDTRAWSPGPAARNADPNAEHAAPHRPQTEHPTRAATGTRAATPMPEPATRLAAPDNPSRPQAASPAARDTNHRPRNIEPAPPRTHHPRPPAPDASARYGDPGAAAAPAGAPDAGERARSSVAAVPEGGLLPPGGARTRHDGSRAPGARRHVADVAVAGATNPPRDVRSESSGREGAHRRAAGAWPDDPDPDRVAGITASDPIAMSHDAHRAHGAPTAAQGAEDPSYSHPAAIGLPDGIDENRDPEAEPRNVVGAYEQEDAHSWGGGDLHHHPAADVRWQGDPHRAAPQASPGGTAEPRPTTDAPPSSADGAVPSSTTTGSYPDPDPDPAVTPLDTPAPSRDAAATAETTPRPTAPRPTNPHQHHQPRARRAGNPDPVATHDQASVPTTTSGGAGRPTADPIPPVTPAPAPRREAPNVAPPPPPTPAESAAGNDTSAPSPMPEPPAEPPSIEPVETPPVAPIDYDIPRQGRRLDGSAITSAARRDHRILAVVSLLAAETDLTGEEVAHRFGVGERSGERLLSQAREELAARREHADDPDLADAGL